MEPEMGLVKEVERESKMEAAKVLQMVKSTELEWARLR
jgi:hypothetical protein